MKTLKAKLSALITIILTLAAPLASGAGYIKFDGIDGDVQESSHKNWCELMSMSQAINRPGGANTGSASLAEFSCSTPVSKASPKIMEAVASGTVWAVVIIEMRIEGTEAGRDAWLKYELENVTVTSHQLNTSTASGASSGRPHGSFSLNFEKIKVTHVDADGNSTTGSALIEQAR